MIVLSRRRLLQVLLGFALCAVAEPAIASEPVWVAARDLSRGARVASGDLRLADAKRPPHDALRSESAALGMELRRAVREGRVVRSRWLLRPSAVKRGDQVAIVLRRGGLEIRGRGRAVTDGAVGDRIRVVNSDSRRQIVGRVEEDGSVHVEP